MHTCTVTLLCTADVVCIKEQAPLPTVNSLEVFPFFIHSPWPRQCDYLSCIMGVEQQQWSFKKRWYHLFGCPIDVMLMPLPVGIIMHREKIKTSRERRRGSKYLQKNMRTHWGKTLSPAQISFFLLTSCCKMAPVQEFAFNYYGNLLLYS